MCQPPLDRRGLLRVGAGVATSATLFAFPAAAAGRSVTRTFRGTFSDPTTADWHYLPFRVPQGVREIEVGYSFEPTSTGVGFSYNVVDIGIFDPSGHDLGDARGFRGWSGGARAGFRLSRTSATPGYLAGPISAGVWNVVLGPYAIVPPGTPWEVAVTLHFGAPGKEFVPQPAPRSVAGSGPGLVPGRHAPAHGPLRRCPHPAGADRGGSRRWPRLHRLLGAQHQLRVVHLGASTLRPTSSC